MAGRQAGHTAPQARSRDRRLGGAAEGVGGHTGLVESALVRELVEAGGAVAARCVQWLVDGTGTAGAEDRIYVSWPLSPMVL